MLLLRLLTLGCQYSVADVVATSVDSGLPVLSS